METKICNKCGEEFPATTEYFYKEKTGRLGLRSSCKLCRRKDNHNYYKSNHDKELRRAEARREADPEYFKAYKRTAKGKYNQIKDKARCRNILFDIPFEYYEEHLWGRGCHYCGCEIEVTGLDRKDNNKGYLIENVVPCCPLCNCHKYQKPYEEFLAETNNKKTIDIERQDGYAYVSQ